MANATTPSTAEPMGYKRSQNIRFQPYPQTIEASQAPTPLVLSEKSFQALKSPASAASHLDSTKAHASAKAKQVHWATLNLRQTWADTAFMRGHLRMAGLRIKYSAEPATVSRIKDRLKSIGKDSNEIQEAIGMPLAKFLKVNPGLPLWVALALVLESMDGFTPEIGGMA
ncbi:MAG: hypothetical protein HQ445_00605 [Polaromonas sp.]|nr:hypothetical protein [Polaromonas sp.]